MKTASKDIEILLEQYPRHPQHLINLLQDVQAEYSYISSEHLTLICDHRGGAHHPGLVGGHVL